MTATPPKAVKNQKELTGKEIAFFLEGVPLDLTSPELNAKIEAFKKQNEDFHLTILTRLARMHRLMEDIQDKLHYLQNPNWKQEPKQ